MSFCVMCQALESHIPLLHLELILAFHAPSGFTDAFLLELIGRDWTRLPSLISSRAGRMLTYLSSDALTWRVTKAINGYMQQQTPSPIMPSSDSGHVVLLPCARSRGSLITQFLGSGKPFLTSKPRHSFASKSFFSSSFFTSTFIDGFQHNVFPSTETQAHGGASLSLTVTPTLSAWASFID